MSTKDYQSARLVKELARATGVTERDVLKVLDQLGLSRVHESAVQANKGAEPGTAEAKIAFKIGKSTIIV